VQQRRIKIITNDNSDRHPQTLKYPATRGVVIS